MHAHIFHLYVCLCFHLFRAKLSLTDIKTLVPKDICSYYQDKANCGSVSLPNKR